MNLAFGMNRVRFLGLFLVFVMSLTGAANAQSLLEARLSALLGQERKSVDVVPSSQLSALTTPPPVSAREITTHPQSISYDSAWLASQSAPSGGAQWRCLAEALYFEARGESVRGIFAVGEVILNRVDSSRFPSSLCTVINQGTGRQFACQFTYTCDGRAETISEPAAFRKVGKIARALMDGTPRDLTNGATFYHTTAVSPSWARRFTRTAHIGVHYFYVRPVRTASN